MPEETQSHPATLAQKVDLLLRTIKHPDGRRFTYEDLYQRTGIKASTISRIRSGENTDPYFRTINALSEAFGIRLSFFSTDMTEEEVRAYLEQPQNVNYLDELRYKQLSLQSEEQEKKLHRIALRAAYLDDEGLKAITDMIDYVLKQRGIKLPDNE